jgi:hypothetical protein
MLFLTFNMSTTPQKLGFKLEKDLHQKLQSNEKYECYTETEIKRKYGKHFQGIDNLVIIDDIQICIQCKWEKSKPNYKHVCYFAEQTLLIHNKCRVKRNVKTYGIFASKKPFTQSSVDMFYDENAKNKNIFCNMFRHVHKTSQSQLIDKIIKIIQKIVLVEKVQIIKKTYHFELINANINLKKKHLKKKQNEKRHVNSEYIIKEVCERLSKNKINYKYIINEIITNQQPMYKIVYQIKELYEKKEKQDKLEHASIIDEIVKKQENIINKLTIKYEYIIDEIVKKQNEKRHVNSEYIIKEVCERLSKNKINYKYITDEIVKSKETIKYDYIIDEIFKKQNKVDYDYIINRITNNMKSSNIVLSENILKNKKDLKIKDFEKDLKIKDLKIKDLKKDLYYLLFFLFVLFFIILKLLV